MRHFRFLFLAAVLLFSLTGCSGGKGGGSLTSLITGATIPETPVEVVEAAKLQTALEADPVYKIDNSEIEMMKAEGIITDEDVAQIQAIQ